jgi:hypothetical protein
MEEAMCYGSCAGAKIRIASRLHAGRKGGS